MSKKIKMASVLAFEKKLVPSDAFFYGTNWDKRTETLPLPLIEKSVRGTISNRLKSEKDSSKLDANVENANLQTVDSCAVFNNQDTLKVSFSLKILGNLKTPSACNEQEFLESYQEMVESYTQEFKFTELAKRYAFNLANARFLWRNRIGAEKIEVIVHLNKEAEPIIFNAFDYALNDFSKVDEKIQQLADKIAQALTGELPYLLIQVEAYALVGNAQEVYPSEELVLEKNTSNKDKKSKILYAVDGVAAMHSQKVGNALRTIDTWYPEFAEQNMPIALEPYGAVTNLGRAFRNPKNKNDFFTLFDKYATGSDLENDDQKHYVIGVLIRGGVFGQSGKS